MTPLRQKLINDLTIRGLSANTQRSYQQSVTGLAKYYKRSPDTLSPEEIQGYLLYLSQERGLSWSSCNTIRHGLRFFYRVTLGRRETHLYLPCAKQPSLLPEILTREELTRLFTVATNRKHRAVLMTTYAVGLRASEVARLKVSDLDSQRACIRVAQGKGMKDRYVPLSPRLLGHLREYWRHHRPQPWLFPGRCNDQPLSRGGTGWIYKTAKSRAGITKPGGIHTLRHCFATALLEAGTELAVIQRLMGHNSIHSTMRYLHIAQDHTTATTSPLDLLDFPTPGR